MRRRGLPSNLADRAVVLPAIAISFCNLDMVLQSETVAWTEQKSVKVVLEVISANLVALALALALKASILVALFCASVC